MYMMYFIMLPFNLLLLGLFLYTGKELTRHQDGCVLSVTLPADKMALPEVSAILGAFRRRFRLLLLAFLLLQIPPFFFRDYPITSTLYCLLWIFGFLAVFQILLNKSFDRLYALKLERGWGKNFVPANVSANSVNASAEQQGHKQPADSANNSTTDDPAGTAPSYIMSVDLTLARLKNKFRYPGWHWIPAFLLTALGSIRWFPPTPEYTAAWLLIGCSFLTYFTLLILYLSFGRTRTVFYSGDSDINLTLNYHRQHSLTKATVLAAYGHGLCWLIGGLFPDACLRPSVMLCTFAASSIIVTFLLAYAFDSFRSKKRILLRQHGAASIEDTEETPTMPDEDCFWRAGSYYNPNDPKLWVEKRIGYGLTINEAHPAAKWFTAAMVLLVGGTFLMVLFWLPLDFPSLSVNTSDTAIIIEAPGYDDEVLLSGIEEAELLSERPTMHKNNGSVIKGYAFGTFYLPDYGQCHVWIRKDQPPYLLLKGDDSLYLIGSDKSEDMEALISTLKAQGIALGEIEKRAGN